MLEVHKKDVSGMGMLHYLLWTSSKMNAASPMSQQAGMFWGRAVVHEMDSQL